ncbi:unnamed protein product [Boreogadus saida]
MSLRVVFSSPLHHVSERTVSQRVVCLGGVNSESSCSLQFTTWNMPTHQCTVCYKTFGEKSNLARHLKIHAIARETFTCDVCGKSLATKPSLVSHQQLHQYPNIILYRQGEARLYCTEAARSVAGARSSTVVDPKWLDLKTAETFGKYCQQGEQNELLKWQKERLLLLPQERPQVQYRHIHHEAGKRRGEKRRLFVDEPEPVTPANRPVQPTGLSSSTRPRPPASTHLQPRPPAALTYAPVSEAPILLVLPAQPQAPSVLFRGPSCSQSFVSLLHQQ